MNEYRNAAQQVKDRYRSRKSYWIRKGLSTEEAESKAQEVFHNSKKQIEFKTKIEKPMKICSAFDSTKTSSSKHVSILRKGFLNFRVSIIVVAFVFIISGATSILVTSSLEVFGNDWQGWIKAILLEIGILTLAVTKVDLNWHWKSIGEWILCRGTLIFLLILSFSVLHTGVETQRSEDLTTAKATSTLMTDLTAERDRWQQTYDGYAENRISDRRDAMKEISRLNAEIRAERRAVFRSPASAVIDMKSNTEMMVRAALLLLNIIFGHKLVQIVTTIKWPPMREGQPAT